MKTPLIHADRLEEAQESGRIGGHELPRIANPSAPDLISGGGGRSSKKMKLFSSRLLVKAPKIVIPNERGSSRAAVVVEKERV